MKHMSTLAKSGISEETGIAAAPRQPGQPIVSPELEIEIDSLTPESWDEVAAGFDDITFDQTACFTNAHWAAHETSNILARRNGVPIAGAQVVIMKPPGLGRGLAYVRSGPFWRPTNETANPSDYKSIVAAMIEEYSRNRGHYLSITPRPNPDFHDNECDLLQQLGLATTRQHPDPLRYFVKTSLPISVQLQSLNQKWRYNLKKSLKNNLKIKFCDDDQGIESFTLLHQEMVKRKRFFDTDPVYLLPKLKSELPDGIRPRIVTASHDGRPVAAATVAVHGDTALYQFGASSREALSLKAGYALHWWIVDWLSASGVRWYDLGGRAGETGLEQFKRGFVGKQGTILALRGELDYWTGARARLVASTIFTVRDIRRRMHSAWNL